MQLSQTGADPAALLVVRAAFAGPGALTGALVGALLGFATRRGLARLRRGARVPAGRCEVALAVLFAGTGSAWALQLIPTAALPLMLGLGWLAVAAGSVDLMHRRLPDALTLPAIPLGILSLTPLGVGPAARGLLGAVAALLTYGAVHLLAPTALGAGDVKLAGSLGAVLAGLGWPAPVLAAGLAALLTAAFALVVVLRAGRWAARSPPSPPPQPPPGRGDSGPRRGLPGGGPAPRRGWPKRSVPMVVPHGPSMLAATWLVVGVLLVTGAPLGTTAAG